MSPITFTQQGIGIYVLDKSGHGPFIGDSGEPVGYLN